MSRSSAKTRCIGLTKKGTRCTRKTGHITGYCALHINQIPSKGDNLCPVCGNKYKTLYHCEKCKISYCNKCVSYSDRGDLHVGVMKMGANCPFKHELKTFTTEWSTYSKIFNEKNK